MKSKLVLAALFAVAALPALAQGTPAPAKDTVATPGIDKRQANMEARIQQGVRSGELTPREANRLERGQDRIRNMEQKAKADGVVTAQERNRLRHAENVESRKIAREKHDRQHDLNHDGRTDRPIRGSEH